MFFLKMKFSEVILKQDASKVFFSKGALIWGYSGYSYSGLGITEYAKFQFRKERSYMFQI